MAVVGKEKPLGQRGDKAFRPWELVSPGDAEESVQLPLGKPAPGPAQRGRSGDSFLHHGPRTEDKEKTGLQEECIGE